jgi:hypothetical protein
MVRFAKSICQDGYKRGHSTLLVTIFGGQSGGQKVAHGEPKPLKFSGKIDVSHLGSQTEPTGIAPKSAVLGKEDRRHAETSNTV